MSIPNTNASHDFIFAKLHGLWANAIRGDTLERLLRSGTPEALQRNLHDVGIDASKRETFHRNLLMREFNTLTTISRLLDERIRQVTGQSRANRTLLAACLDLQRFAPTS